MPDLLRAQTQFAEHQLGTIASGMQADIATLSRNIVANTPEEMRHDTRADLTLRDSVPIFDRYEAHA